MATIKANGIEIYYEVHGEGPPLLLIMGLGANATAWWKQVPAFSEHYRVIAFDNRGAGRSEKPHGPVPASRRWRTSGGADGRARRCLPRTCSGCRWAG